MKNLKNLGKALSKAEQQSINGGGFGQYCCEWCPDGSCNGWVESPKIKCPFAAAC